MKKLLLLIITILLTITLSGCGSYDTDNEVYRVEESYEACYTYDAVFVSVDKHIICVIDEGVVVYYDYDTYIARLIQIIEELENE